MNLAVWNPFKEMEDLLGRYNRFSGNSLENYNTELKSHDWSPSVDVVENKKNYAIKAEMPGVKKEDVKVDLKDNVLTIHGEKKSKKEEEDDNHHRSECFYGSFTRSFTLPDGLKKEEINASYKNGVLELSIPKDKDYKPEPEKTEIKIT